MPRRPGSLRRTQSQADILDRWSGKRRLYSTDQLSDDDFGVEMKPDVFDNDEKSQDQGEFLEKLDLATISDIFQLCKDEHGSRKLTTLLYMILRYFGYQWRVTDNFLRQIGANRCETAHKWAETFLSGDFEAFFEDGRGGKVQIHSTILFPNSKLTQKLLLLMYVLENRLILP